MDRLHRRDFLAASGGAVAAVTLDAAPAAADTAVAAPALASGVRELRLSTMWPDDVAGFGDSAQRLARRIERASGGRFKIIAADSDADLTHGFEHARTAHHPGFAYFAGLPGHGALNALDLDAWIAVGGGQDLWDGLGAGFGVKPLLAGHTGRWPGLWSAKPVARLADLAGQGLLAQGLVRDVAAGLGAAPLDLGAAAWPEALASGEAAAAEWGGAQANMALGLAAPAKYVVGSGLAPSGSAVTLGVRRAAWDGLAPSDQLLFSACAGEEFRLTLAESRANEAVLRRVLAERHGIGFAPMPEDVAHAVSGVADAVIAHAASRDRAAARIDASYMAFRHVAMGGVGRWGAGV